MIEAGAEPYDIPFIAATYRSERQGAISDREGRTKSPFLRDVLHRMAQVGLEDTPLNRAAATEEIFRARADTLLASADDPKKPKLAGSSRAEHHRIEAGPGVPPPRPSILWDENPKPAPAIPAPIAPAAALPTIAAEPPPVQQLGSELQPPKPRTARKDLPLSRFDRQLEELIANHKDEWEDDTASDVLPAYALHLPRIAAKRVRRAYPKSSRQTSAVSSDTMTARTSRSVPPRRRERSG